ncbi:hypothetical protein BDF20DRAFT_814804 [Mycotypha africana]|uniref:uncharacterized protein n=1 Tax=Mycotypha africana TaxID=64632 RepID=UPI0023009606|nr:uncharacterized protein BDF20DRAFT_814804 [Mycotypha africana]KAI8988515.1 hypothetical protein BDF20DRAFT_814804 [Mycotypha africana]
MNFHAADPDTSFDNINMSNKHNSDPAIDKLKSLFWKKAGGLQRTLGSIANFDTWEEFGKLLQREADIDYNDAVSRLQRGEASRLHGEYDRLMGYLNYAIGHVAGDNEMQAKANDRLQKAMKEIDKSSDK